MNPRLPNRIADVIAGSALLVGVWSSFIQEGARAQAPTRFMITSDTKYAQARNPFAVDDVAYAPSTPTPTVANPLGLAGAAGQPGVFGHGFVGPASERVVGISVGPQTVALVTTLRGGYQTVSVGDTLDGHRVTNIELTGVTLDNGTVLSADPMSGSFAFPASPGGVVPAIAPEAAGGAGAGTSAPAPALSIPVVTPAPTQAPQTNPYMSSASPPPLPYGATYATPPPPYTTP